MSIMQGMILQYLLVKMYIYIYIYIYICQDVFIHIYMVSLNVQPQKSLKEGKNTRSEGERIFRVESNSNETELIVQE